MVLSLFCSKKALISPFSLIFIAKSSPFIMMDLAITSATTPESATTVADNIFEFIGSKVFGFIM